MSRFERHQAAFRRAQQLLTRREALQKLGAGFGSIGLAATMAQRGALSMTDDLLTPKAPHFAPKAKHVIQLFMPGGPSQIDTFDYKPDCEKYKGQRPKIVARKTLRNTKLGLMPSFFPFRQYGECGKYVSDLFPHVAQHVDDICFIHSMHTDVPEHAGGIMMMNCGHLQATRPSMGAWLGYGLGAENRDLPAFIAMSPRAKPRGTLANWGNAFLPGAYAGTYVNIEKLRPDQPIPNLENAGLSRAERRRQADLLATLNRQHLERRGRDRGLEASLDNMELAYRMQFAVPELFDLSDESPTTLEMYGDAEYAKGCLLARRMIERGVRCVQLSHSISGYDIAWDTGHGNVPKGHKDLAVACDQGIAALIVDLKQRGLFDETLVIWGGEFGRAPTSEGKLGRDHDHYGFTVWMAGGGIKGGMSYGATDNFGCSAVENRVHVHDLHATILHLMGLDHERLTYRYSGRDYRLTDVHGQVIHDIIA